MPGRRLVALRYSRGGLAAQFNVDITTLLTFLSKVQGGASALLTGVEDPVKDGVATLVD